MSTGSSKSTISPENNNGSTGHDVEEQTSPRRTLLSGMRGLPVEVPIFSFYALFSLFLTWPVISKLSTSSYGFPSDNLGTMWKWWWFRNAAAFGAKASFCPLVGYPFGTSINTVPQEPVTGYAARFLMLFANEIIVYNILILTSFFLSGITMYYLVRYLTKNRWAAFFGGFVFMLCPYHAYNSMMFLGLSIIQWMPLFILALLVFTEKPSIKSAAFLFVASALVVGSSVHYGMLMAIFAAAFLLGRFIYRRTLYRARRKRGTADRRRPVVINRKTLTLAIVVIIAVILFIVPFYYYHNIFTESGGPAEWPTREMFGSTRTLEMAHSGAARPWDYLLPFQWNPVLGEITSKLTGRGVVSFGNSLYLGWTVIALAVFTIVMASRRRKKEKPQDTDDKADGPRASNDSESDADSGEKAETRQGNASGDDSRYKNEGADLLWNTTNRANVWGLVAVAIAGFVMSMPPYLTIGSSRIPLPSMLFRPFFPEFRFYLRVGVLVLISFVALACFGLAWLTASRKRIYQFLICLLVVGLAFGELTLVPPFRYFEFEEVPQVYEAISEFPDDLGLVFYPAFERGYFNSQRYQFFQRWFEKPMLNAAVENSRGEALRRTVYNPYNPQTPAILSRFDIEHVIYLAEMFEQYEGTEPKEEEIRYLPEGIELEETFRSEDIYGDADIYRVTAEKAILVPIYMGDITVPHIDHGRETVRLMETEGIIRLENYAGSNVSADVSIPVSNISVLHRLSVSAEGEVLWEGELAGSESASIDLKDLDIPDEGLDLVLDVEGQLLELVSAERELFNTETASLKLGDVSIKTRWPARRLQEEGPSTTFRSMDSNWLNTSRQEYLLTAFSLQAEDIFRYLW